QHGQINNASTRPACAPSIAGASESSGSYEGSKGLSTDEQPGNPAFRRQAMDAACDAYRRMIKQEEARRWRYTLWNPAWETEDVDLLLRKGREHAASAARLARVCGGLEAKRILEVGCGFGRMACELALLGAEVAAVEVAGEYLHIGGLVAMALGFAPGRNLKF